MNKPIVLTISAVVAGAITIASVLLLVLLSSKTTAATCEQKGRSHAITISKGKVSPATTEVKLCDSVTITNADPETRKIGFGDHGNHKEYAGVTQKLMRSGQSFTITVTETGTVGFHDHYYHDTQGTLVVLK